eukprot:scaffold1345_cov581-Prasinococcus_capsulatus_cf.AAC.5
MHQLPYPPQDGSKGGGRHHSASGVAQAQGAVIGTEAPASRPACSHQGFRLGQIQLIVLAVIAGGKRLSIGGAHVWVGPLAQEDDTGAIDEIGLDERDVQEHGGLLYVHHVVLATAPPCPWGAMGVARNGLPRAEHGATSEAELVRQYFLPPNIARYLRAVYRAWYKGPPLFQKVIELLHGRSNPHIFSSSPGVNYPSPGSLRSAV